MIIVEADVTKRVGGEVLKNADVDAGQFHQRHQRRPGVPGSIITGELVKGGKWITISGRLNPNFSALPAGSVVSHLSYFSFAWLYYRSIVSCYVDTLEITSLSALIVCTGAIWETGRSVMR